MNISGQAGHGCGAGREAFLTGRVTSKMEPSIKSTPLRLSHAKCLVRSYAHFTGRKLIRDHTSDAELAQALDKVLPTTVTSQEVPCSGRSEIPPQGEFTAGAW